MSSWERISAPGVPGGARVRPCGGRRRPRVRVRHARRRGGPQRRRPGRHRRRDEAGVRARRADPARLRRRPGGRREGRRPHDRPGRVGRHEPGVPRGVRGAHSAARIAVGCASLLFGAKVEFDCVGPPRLSRARGSAECIGARGSLLDMIARQRREAMDEPRGTERAAAPGAGRRRDRAAVAADRRQPCRHRAAQPRARRGAGGRRRRRRRAHRPRRLARRSADARRAGRAARARARDAALVGPAPVARGGRPSRHGTVGLGVGRRRGRRAESPATR